jgi:AraC-like DNA-binding protein
VDIQLQLRSGNFTLGTVSTRYVENRTGTINRMHTHPVYHLMYVTRGEGVFTVNGAVTQALEGMLYIISPNQPHQFTASNDQPLSNYESTFVLLDESGNPGDICFFDLLEQYYGKMLPEALRRSPLTVPSQLKSLVDGGFRQMIEQHRLLPNNLHNKLRLIDFIFQIFDIVNRAGHWQYPPTHHSTLPKLLKFIQNNLHRSLTLHELANHIHMTPNYLCRLFKREMGVTLNHYLLRLRIEKSIKLLLYTDEPIYRIAEQLGFESSSYFSRVFRAEQGVSPTQFREYERSPREEPARG